MPTEQKRTRKATRRAPVLRPASSKAGSRIAGAPGAAKKRLSVSGVTNAHLAQMERGVRADFTLRLMFNAINSFLEASEYEVIEMMVKSKVWTGPAPVDPGGSGNVEFGMVPYLLNHPGNNRFLITIKRMWPHVVGKLPRTRIDDHNFQALKNAVAPGQQGLVAADGTWYSEGKYGQLDAGWLEAAFDYMVTYSTKILARFAQKPATVALSGAVPSQVTLALVGDWGTGHFRDSSASSVMRAIVAQKPDYIIHLGDVYYAGTKSEEKKNLLGLWPAAYDGKSFTLNSNNEMYRGAEGYYAALYSKIFRLQNRTSYFALEYGDGRQPGGPWTVVGLDSGYWSSSPLIMRGSIQGAKHKKGATAQAKFLRGLKKKGLSPQNAVVLSHHNPIEADGSALVSDRQGNNLWAQVTSLHALNGVPKAWYWGHVHNAIVYPNPTFTGHHFYGRCVGHGALPFGDAWGLAAAPPTQVLCYANDPNPRRSPWMKNGFLLLTITQSGQVTEAFYQQDGTPAPWVKPFTYRLGASAAATGRPPD